MIEVKNKHHALKSKISYLLLSLGFSSLLLGAYGWFKFFLLQGIEITYLTALYNSIQTFIFETGFQDEYIPISLEIARFLSPAVLATTIITLVLTRVSEWRDSLTLWMYYKKHYVICGLGSMGNNLAVDCLNKKNRIRVVIIEQNKDNTHIADLIQKGAIVIIGDAGSPEVLKKAKINNAKAVFALTDSDTVNVQITFKVKEFLQLVNCNSFIECFVHIADAATLRLFYNSSYCQETSDNIYVKPFNINQISGNFVLDKFPPDTYVNTGRGEPAVQILIIGLDKIGENILISFARNCHYLCNIPDDNDKELINKKNTIHIVDSNAKQRIDQIKTLYPRLEQVLEIRVHPTGTREFNEFHLAALVEEYGIPVAYICLENDEERFISLQMLSQYLMRNELNVVNVLPVKTLSGSLFNDSNNLIGSEINNINPVESISTIEVLVNEQLDKTAKDLNSFDPYGAIPTKEDIETKWNRDTPENFKQSSRDSAEHLKIKIRALGYNWVELKLNDVEAIENLIKSNLSLSENLQHIEHIRFVCERIIEGWETTDDKLHNDLWEIKEKILNLKKQNSPLADEQKKKLKGIIDPLKKKKINDTIRPFRKIHEYDKEYNKQIVNKFHELVKLIIHKSDE